MTFLETVICLIILRCDSYLSSRGVQNSLERFPALSAFVSRIREEDIKNWAGVTKTRSSLTVPEQRYLSLLAMMNSDTVLQSLLDLCMAVFVCPEFDAYLVHHFGYSVNIHLAFILENTSFPDETEILQRLSAVRKICDVDEKASPLQYAALSIDERTFAWLSGDDALNPYISDFTELFRYKDGKELNEPFVNTEQIKKGEKFFKHGGKVLQISGRGGRRFAARRIAMSAKKDFLFLNIADLFSGPDRDSLKILKDALIREALFDGAGICIFGITPRFIMGGEGVRDRERHRTVRDLEVLERLLFTPVISEGIPLILISDEPVLLIKRLEYSEYLLLELPERLDYASRLVLWKGFSKLYGLKTDPGDFATKYQLNASEVSGVLRSFSERRGDKPGEGNDDEEMLNRISIELLGKEQDTGRVIYPSVRLDDVKIKQETRAVLNDVVNSVRASSLLLDTWGLRENYPYGRCVSLLLSGPPGTGKTMTANAIAGELGMPLYQINLSNIVDKYIGETEKNLEKAFLYAEKTNTVLFFDEADSLFGTRSEVHDSKDRYANTEISYLLQRIEAFDGVVIMATNIKGNIDPAFIRRIRYVVRFENPDEKLRKEIWESCLKDSIPHGEIDLDYLASQFDKFTGSVIKTVFLNACAFAAGREESLEMKHLVHALKQELEKATSVSFSMDALGKYSFLL